MTARRRFLPVLAAALIWPCAAPAVAIDWVTVGGAGNACDAQPQGCFGAVAAAYRIARTEITNAQYAEFLNAVAKDDPNALYNPSMASSGAGHGGITRSGAPGTYAYTVVAGRGDLPVNYVSFWDALRFANWLHNGQPVGAQGPATTEGGAYTLTAPGIAGNSIARNAEATVALASEDEWYKAAYYDTASARYFDYPSGTDTASVCSAPGATANTANCGVAGGTPGAGNLTAVGSYTAAASPNGTFDQGGNVWEWNEAVIGGTSRGLRGGAFNHNPSNLLAATRSNTVPDAESSVMGFRVVSLPEPGMGATMLIGVLALIGLHRCHHRKLPALVLLAMPWAMPAAAQVSRSEPQASEAHRAGDPSLIGGGQHGGSFTWDYCEGKPDATPVPPDPRTLAQPGTNAGKAVAVNTYWKNCHVDPEAVDEVGAPETCGELRERFWHGKQLLDPGSEGPGGLFTGTTASSSANSATFSAQMYNQLWMVWGGYTQRPANFDELAAERYGSAFSSSPNPYPLPGEDPNQTNGGSGRLPELFTQMRNGEYGSWSSEITVTCHGCHSGNVGSQGYGGEPGVLWGGGSSLADLNLLLRDMLALGWEASAATILNLNHTRGRNDASLINVAFASSSGGSSGGSFDPETFFGVLTLFGVMNSGSTADMDTPAWWNMGHRPAKFVDGVFPMDSPRVDAVFYAPTIGITPQGQTWMRENGPLLNTWIETLKSPPYPSSLPAIDTTLAEQGAELFHTLDLWSRAPTRNGEAIARPAGNGSCAGCHGVYAQRYVNDPAFLDSPELEGIAAYQVPLDIIGTDPERLLANNESVQTAGRDSFFGYPPTKGTAQDCGPQNGAEVRPAGRELGYLAPPLYGVWATAPYFHNGSVPNLWEVLKSSDRQRIWRRWSKPRAAEQADCPTCSVIMGYETDLAAAFDPVKVGWRYDAIACEVQSITNPSVSPYVSCNPDPAGTSDPLGEQILAQLYGNILLFWNIGFVPPLTPVQMEDRKIFNTWEFAQGNEGHEFSDVLSDAERSAIIEYMKTL
jgi:formylglycine-generating enzyme required for sulfatase activity